MAIYYIEANSVWMKNIFLDFLINVWSVETSRPFNKDVPNDL